MAPNTQISILLACYNGEKFMSDQLESLFAQTYTNWRVFIRDDGSTDQTVSIINKYAEQDKRITIVETNSRNLGSCQNFATLFNLVRNNFEYIMFCDQDDYWLPFKIEDTLRHMQHFEAQHEKELPLLVYTNFKYTYSNLKEIKSKKNFQATKASKVNFAHLLAQNPVYGCTMMLNRQLAAMVDAIPPQAENHDYWVALVASALGKIAYLKKQTILYRQHSNNISTSYDSDSLIKRFKRIFLQRKNLKDARLKIQMAITFKKIYFTLLPDRGKKILDEYLDFGTRKKLLLLFKNLQNGVRRQTISQTFLFYLSILLLKKES